MEEREEKFNENEAVSEIIESPNEDNDLSEGEIQEESEVKEPDYKDMTPEELKAQIKEEIRQERKENLIEWIKDIVIAAILAAIIMTFIKPIVIQQESMLDNYLPGDYVILSKQAYKIFGEPERGDVIVFKTDMELENGKTKNLIKRIIALPGERVEVRDDGYVYINGELLDEPYIKEQGISQWIAGPVDVTVGEGELFVCGDNREVSLDSRSIGCIDQDQIMGKVKCRIFNTQGLKKS